MEISRTTDYETLAGLNKSVQDVHSNLSPKYFKEYDHEAVKDFFRTMISNPKHIFLLLEDNGQKLGYAMIEIRNYPENPFKKGYKSVYVHQIGVVETEQKKGYGSRLMNEIYDIARTEEIDLVELDYWSENNIAKDFYKKQGFAIYREFVNKQV